MHKKKWYLKKNSWKLIFLRQKLENKNIFKFNSI